MQRPFKITLPPYQEHVLRNGVHVYTIDLGEQDTLMFNWIFYAGNWYEEKNLVAATTNYLLKNGTADKSAFEINEHFEYYGAYLNRHCHNEIADITLHCLGKYVPELLPAIAELITGSVFPQEELDIYKKNMQQHLQVGLMKSDFVAGRLIDACLFGKQHPYGKYSSMEDYASLQQDEIRAYHRRYYEHGHCAIFVSGKLPKDLIRQLEDHFGSLPLHSHLESVQAISHPIIPAQEKNTILSTTRTVYRDRCASPAIFLIVITPTSRKWVC